MVRIKLTGTDDRVLRPTPHPKIYSCLGASNLDETFRGHVSRYGGLTVKIPAQNVEPIES